MHNLHWWKIYQLFVSKTKYFETVNQIRLIIIMGNAKLVSNRIHMWCTPTKQETSDILGKMSFWYHCKEHTCSFHLIPKSNSYSSYFLRYAKSCIGP